MERTDSYRNVQWGSAAVVAVAAVLAVHSLYWFVAVWGSSSPAHDFGVYYQAFVEASQGTNPYLPLDELTTGGFLYHPFALTFVGVLSWLASPFLFFPFERGGVAFLLWSGASLLAWLVSVALAVRLARMPSGKADHNRGVHGPTETTALTSRAYPG